MPERTPMKPEDYRDIWQPMAPSFWLQYPRNRAQATVCWYGTGSRRTPVAPPVFKWRNSYG